MDAQKKHRLFKERVEERRISVKFSFLERNLLKTNLPPEYFQSSVFENTTRNNNRNNVVKRDHVQMFNKQTFKIKMSDFYEGEAIEETSL